jgi:hypothetical protein
MTGLNLFPGGSHNDRPAPIDDPDLVFDRDEDSLYLRGLSMFIDGIVELEPQPEQTKLIKEDDGR